MNETRPYDVVNGREVDPELLGAVIMSLLVLTAISYIITAFLLGKIFKKAGLPRWQAWVPIFNVWRLLELGNQDGRLALISLLSAALWYLAPFVSLALFIVLYIYILIAMDTISKKLGKANWFVLIAVFIPVAWMIWLGYDNSKWPKPKKTVSQKTKTGE